MVKKTKEIMIREDRGQYIYEPQEIVHVPASNIKRNLNILYAILIVVLAAFGIVGQDLALLTAILGIALAGGIPAYLLYRYTGQFWVGVLLGLFIVSVIIATDMNERAFENSYMIAAALQHISWVGIGTLVALWAIGRKIVP